MTEEIIRERVTETTIEGIRERDTTTETIKEERGDIMIETMTETIETIKEEITRKNVVIGIGRIENQERNSQKLPLRP